MMAEKISVCFVLGVFNAFHSKTLRFMEINRKISWHAVQLGAIAKALPFSLQCIITCRFCDIWWLTYFEILQNSPWTILFASFLFWIYHLVRYANIQALFQFTLLSHKENNKIQQLQVDCVYLQLLCVADMLANKLFHSRHDLFLSLCSLNAANNKGSWTPILLPVIYFSKWINNFALNGGTLRTGVIFCTCWSIGPVLGIWPTKAVTCFAPSKGNCAKN